MSALEAASRAVFTSPIPSWWSRLELRAKHQIKLNKLCWTCSLGSSSSTGQSQKQSRRKSTGSIIGAMEQGKREGKDRWRQGGSSSHFKQQKGDTGLKRANLNRAEGCGSHNCKCHSDSFGNEQSIHLVPQLLSPAEPNQGWQQQRVRAEVSQFGHSPWFYYVSL